MHGYGINHTARGEVISKLFQNTASILCENGIQQFGGNVYAHDSDVLWTYIMSAFAMDVTDVIELYRNLINHLRINPIFYYCKYFLPIEDRFEDSLSDNIRVFAVFDGSKLIGMVNTEPPDKGFAIAHIIIIGTKRILLQLIVPIASMAPIVYTSSLLLINPAHYLRSLKNNFFIPHTIPTVPTVAHAITIGTKRIFIIIPPFI